MGLVVVADVQFAGGKVTVVLVGAWSWVGVERLGVPTVV